MLCYYIALLHCLDCRVGITHVFFTHSDAGMS
jgi:hypothetical protein